MVRYYGHFSPAFRGISRGKRNKRDQDSIIPCILEPDGSSKEYRRNWSRLIQKIYETDPLCCPKRSGKMRILSFIEDEQVIEKILKHLGLWEKEARPPPKPRAAPTRTDTVIDDSFSQLPVSDKWLYVDPEYPEACPPLEGHLA